MRPQGEASSDKHFVYAKGDNSNKSISTLYKLDTNIWILLAVQKFVSKRWHDFSLDALPYTHLSINPGYQ